MCGFSAENTVNTLEPAFFAHYLGQGIQEWTK